MQSIRQKWTPDSKIQSKVCIDMKQKKFFDAQKIPDAL